MKKLILIRHAEPQPEQFGSSDRERPLSGEGMQELELIRRKLQGKLQGLGLVLCSNVKRARQTLEGIKPILPSACESAFDDALYHAPAAGILSCLQNLEDTMDFVMVIGHNPGMSEFLNRVVSLTCVQAGGMPKLFPTAGVAIFEGNFKKWREAALAQFTLQVFLRPE